MNLLTLHVNVYNCLFTYIVVYFMYLFMHLLCYFMGLITYSVYFRVPFSFVSIHLFYFVVFIYCVMTSLFPSLCLLKHQITHPSIHPKSLPNIYILIYLPTYLPTYGLFISFSFIHLLTFLDFLIPSVFFITYSKMQLRKSQPHLFNIALTAVQRSLTVHKAALCSSESAQTFRSPVVLLT